MHGTNPRAVFCAMQQPPSLQLSNQVATHPDEEPRDFREVNRQLKKAIRDCDDLLTRARRLLRRSEQDNDPPGRTPRLD